jgi:DeoR/GlpR family transcriptional regulator of sugar metabolism
MLTQERQNIIRDRLIEKGKVIAAELATEFRVSEDTVRRDLRDLAGLGFCQRVYGGAIREAPFSGLIHNRLAQVTAEKAAIAKAAAELARDGQTIFMDAGSTNLLIARAFPLSLSATLVTNAPLIATSLADHDRIRVVLLGGMLDQSRGAALGSITIGAISKIYADQLFLGTCGIDPHHGISAFDASEAEVKQALVAQSDRVCVAATADKLGSRAPFHVAPAHVVTDLVTSGSADPSLVMAFRTLGAYVEPTPF